MEHITPTCGRTIEEATKILWKIIDEAKTYMQDPILTSKKSGVGLKP
jgi:hypothetical protein